ncbi:alpha/beta fold hydrolase [Actinophytocola gossypii]|uniref:Alpha/beta fold hydrolase n=1 Tax=Actinophytocola gossypii TaxID=2812003 RepID=A0ABT2J7U5_9PSEU|nr:alpha/beta fold hydrolase [Actinophytocola gossypii]MCT2583781.1 alpha/beta fold hydrolase [Actinophytocola gossypii]
MSHLRLGGRNVRYRVTGDGDPVLLLHGIARSLDDWTEQHDLLDGHRVYSVDLAGFGESDPLPGRATLPPLAEFTREFLDAVGETRPVHVVGNSLGGAVAMLLALRYPSRVRTLVLANSAGFGQEVTAALRILAVRPLGRLLLRPSRAAARRTERALFRDARFVTDDRVERSFRLAGRPHGARVLLELCRSLGTIRGISQPWRDAVLTATAAAAAPTLVVWGSHDLILPAAHLEAARTLLPHARTHLFENTGHMPQIERADEFADLLREFWAESVPTSADGRSRSVTG